MSYSKEVTLWCDHTDENDHDCAQWTQGTGQFKRVSQLRQWAEERGWNVGLPGGHDLCPEHADKTDELDL